MLLPQINQVKSHLTEGFQTNQLQSLLFLDGNNFGLYNRLLGKLNFNLVIESFERRIQEVVDRHPETLAARGGDEFFLAFPRSLDQGSIQGIIRELTCGQTFIAGEVTRGSRGDSPTLRINQHAGREILISIQGERSPEEDLRSLAKSLGRMFKEGGPLAGLNYHFRVTYAWAYSTRIKGQDFDSVRRSLVPEIERQKEKIQGIRKVECNGPTQFPSIPLVQLSRTCFLSPSIIYFSDELQGRYYIREMRSLALLFSLSLSRLSDVHGMLENSLKQLSLEELYEDSRLRTGQIKLVNSVLGYDFADCFLSLVRFLTLKYLPFAGTRRLILPGPPSGPIVWVRATNLARAKVENQLEEFTKRLGAALNRLSQLISRRILAVWTWLPMTKSLEDGLRELGKVRHLCEENGTSENVIGYRREFEPIYRKLERKLARRAGQKLAKLKGFMNCVSFGRTPAGFSQDPVINRRL